MIELRNPNLTQPALSLAVRYWAYADLTNARPTDAGWYWGLAEHGRVERWEGPYPDQATAATAGQTPINRLLDMMCGQ